jgi:hypothetical protein
MTTWGMCTACWITKATDTHSEHVIFIAFPQQQWLCKHTSVLCYTYIACLGIYHTTVAFLEQDMKEEEMKKNGTTIFHIQTTIFHIQTTIFHIQTHLLFMWTMLHNPPWPHSFNCWSGC